MGLRQEGELRRRKSFQTNVVREGLKTCGAKEKGEIGLFCALVLAFLVGGHSVRRELVRHVTVLSNDRSFFDGTPIEVVVLGSHELLACVSKFSNYVSHIAVREQTVRAPTLNEKLPHLYRPKELLPFTCME